MSYALLLTIYCILIATAALAGGWLPMILRLTHTRMQLSMSFVGGTMLGVGILHLLPHAYFSLREIYPCVWWMLGGFLAMFFVERVFHFHHHDVPGDESEESCSHSHEDHDHTAHHHAHDHAHSHGHGESPRGWQAALVGLALHSAADGMALAASVAAEPDAGESWFSPSGLAVFLVVFLHKPFDSLTLSTMMGVKGESSRARHVVNLLYACAVPLGVLLFMFGIGQAHAATRQILGAALAFSAGTFLCISTSDLLPELQFHAHDRLKLSAALLLGLSVAGGIVFIESSTHAHDMHGWQEEHSHAEHPADAHDHHADEHGHNAAHDHVR